MGAVSFSIDKTLVAHLKQVLPLPIFVETGSFEGESLAQVLPLFEQMYSVELSPDYYQKTVQRFQDNAAVQLYHDRSEDFLRQLQPTLHDRSVLYWLDAHWCVADETAGEESQCPLLEELAAIGSLNPDSVILIDDARLFLCTPPAPHRVAHWPGLDAILRQLFKLSTAHEVMVVNDVIVYYPAAIRSAMQSYAHNHSIDWLDALEKLRYFEYLVLQNEKQEAIIQGNEQAVAELTVAANDRLQVIEEQAQKIAQNEQAIAELTVAAGDRLQVIEEQAQKIAQNEQAVAELTVAAGDRLQVIEEQAQKIAQLEYAIGQLKQEQKQRIREIRCRKRETVHKVVETARMQQETIRDQTEQIKVLKRSLESTADRRLRRRLSQLSRFFD